MNVIKSKFVIFTLLSFFVYNKAVAAKQPPLILLSIDGFSNEYLSKYAPKNILSLAKAGVQAEALLPVFPSKTFPNHLSIATGMYPVNHGIVHNYFYHRGLKKHYRLGAAKQNSAWLTALPIWNIAEQQGVKTAIYFWPESEAQTTGGKPSYNFSYNKKTSNQTRVNKIIDWLKLPSEKKPALIVSYFSTVDHAGHFFGPSSVEVKQAVADIDLLIGYLLTRLKNEIIDEVDIILVSDHGMMRSGIDNSIDTNTLLTLPSNVTMVNGQTQLYFYSDNADALLDVRSQLSANNSLSDEAKNNKASPYKIYSKGQYPEHWHFNQKDNLSPFKQNNTVPDLIVDASPPYNFVTGNKYKSFATHGYDPLNHPQLDGIFIANGPSFNKKMHIAPFENIHIFPLLIHLLSLNQPNKIDGNMNVLLPILFENKEK